MSKSSFVSVIVVTLNEEKYIEKCLISLLSQSYPKELYEVILVDGGSADRTVEIEEATIRDFYQEHGKELPVVRYIANEKRLLASGWNLGIKNANGEYVIRIDAHGYASNTFIEQSVHIMEEVGDAVCVGGKLNSESNGKVGSLIAKVLSSPFGVGNSCFRVSSKAQYADTVAFGLYRKSIFEEVGYFDETLKRHQDNDMHARIRDAGGKFYYDPSIRSTYITRDTIRGMLKQAYQNGKGMMSIFRRNKSSVAIRHMVPFGFVLGIISLFVLGFFSKVFWHVLLWLIIIYLLLGFTFGCKKSKDFMEIVLMPWLFGALHISYGVGTLVGLFMC